MTVDYKPTPRCRHAVFYPGQVKGALDGNQNCSVCTALPAREKPGALTAPTDNGRGANDRSSFKRVAL